MSYDAKMMAMMRTLMDGKPIKSHIYIDKRLKFEEGICRAWAVVNMLQYDLQEVSWLFWPREFNENYLIVQFVPIEERQSKYTWLYFFPEDLK